MFRCLATYLYLFVFQKQTAKLLFFLICVLVIGRYCMTDTNFFILRHSIHEDHTQGHKQKQNEDQYLDLSKIVPRDDTNILKKQLRNLKKKYQSRQLKVNGSLPFQGPYSFLKNYKNPCYRVHDKIQCLPYFYLIGVPKAGTSDLFTRICRHQDVMPPLKKETQFWPRTRFKGESYNFYLKYFNEASQKIDSLTNATENGMIYHYAITGTATPSDFWDNDLWQYDMYNKHLDEPAVITPHHLYHINPKSKFIIIFRNPAERLYSDYCYRRHTRPTATSERFHGNVTRAIKIYTDCFSKYSIRKCVYDRNLARDAVVWIRLGLYHIYMMHWLKVFPRQQFLLLDYDEYRNNRKRSLGRVYKFLELRTSNLKQWEQILQGVAKNTNFRRKKKAGPMLEDTRLLLNTFYRNSSTEIAKYFGEDKPKWSKI